MLEYGKILASKSRSTEIFWRAFKELVRVRAILQSTVSFMTPARIDTDIHLSLFDDPGTTSCEAEQSFRSSQATSHGRQACQQRLCVAVFDSLQLVHKVEVDPHFVSLFRTAD